MNSEMFKITVSATVLHLLSSNERPLVSGKYVYKNPNTRIQTTASKKKKAAHPIASFVDKNVEAINVATARLQSVATDMAFARITVEKTSEGMSHAPGV